MNRRDALVSLIALGATATPRSLKSETRKSARTAVLGVLSALPIAPPEQWARSPFWSPLRKLGWIEGENLKVERASAEGDMQRLPALAEELVRKRVDAIFAASNEGALAAARATKTIPIVFWGVNYPVEMGLVESFARPGRNVTGIALFVGPNESAKTLDYLREILPRAQRLSYIYESSHIRRLDGTEWPLAHDYIKTAARSRGFDLHEYPISKEEHLDAAFKNIVGWGAQALYVGYSQLTIAQTERIAAFANRNRLPSAFNSEVHVDEGGLLSYGPDVLKLFQRSAAYVDRILRGARPNELPVELPSKFDLVINIKAADALGIKIPRSILLRADRVIE